MAHNRNRIRARKSMQNALDIYYSNLVNIKARADRNLINADEKRVMLDLNISWYHHLYDYHFITAEDKYRKEDIAQNNYLYTFSYRGIEVNVFNDDYGQQEYCEFIVAGEKRDASGGCYNFWAEEVFCHQVDYALERAYLTGKIILEELRCTATL